VAPVCFYIIRGARTVADKMIPSGGAVLGAKEISTMPEVVKSGRFQSGRLGLGLDEDL
jgi:hypothetical protein